MNGVAVTVPKLNPKPVFNDRQIDRYWSTGNPWNSVKVAGTGTKIDDRDSRARRPTDNMIVEGQKLIR